jgi:hypothetical protein
MRYVDLDPILGPWAHSHGLYVSTVYRDDEVRFVDVVSPAGRRYQLWLDVSSGDRVGVHVWDFKKRRQDFVTSISELNATLDRALSAMRTWIAAESAG